MENIEKSSNMLLIERDGEVLTRPNTARERLKFGVDCDRPPILDGQRMDAYRYTITPTSNPQVFVVWDGDQVYQTNPSTVRRFLQELEEYLIDGTEFSLPFNDVEKIASDEDIGNIVGCTDIDILNVENEGVFLQGHDIFIGYRGEVFDVSEGIEFCNMFYEDLVPKYPARVEGSYNSGSLSDYQFYFLCRLSKVYDEVEAGNSIEKKYGTPMGFDPLD